jgi:hypothetical protein
VKAKRDELARIQKEITPKLIKKLHRHIERKNQEKNRAMAECFVGVLKGSSSVTREDIDANNVRLLTNLIGVLQETRKPYRNDE